MSSLYTVEQVELIRRLRETGITADQISEAFRTLDRLDADLGNLGGEKQGEQDERANLSQITFPNLLNRRSSGLSDSLSTSPSNKCPRLRDETGWYSSVVNSTRNGESSPPNLNSKPPTPSENAVRKTPSTSSTANSVLIQHLCGPCKPITVSSGPNPSSWPSLNAFQPLALQTQTVVGSPNVAFSRQSVVTHTPSPTNGAIRPITPGSSVSMSSGGLQQAIGIPPPYAGLVSRNGSDVSLTRASPFPRMDVDTSSTEDFANVQELLKNGEEAAIMEIKGFVNQYQLRQTMIAQMCSLSQPYVSKFLNGNYKELSWRVRSIMFNWYLNNKQDPEKLARFSCDPVARIDLVPTTRLSEFVQQRRERYVFRPILLKVLDDHFADHAYPDLEKRMEIAAECNRVLATEKKGALLPKEFVSPQIVANWFANKRKEVKRRHGNVVGTLDSGNFFTPDPNFGFGLYGNQRPISLTSSEGESPDPDTPIPVSGDLDVGTFSLPVSCTKSLPYPSGHMLNNNSTESGNMELGSSTNYAEQGNRSIANHGADRKDSGVFKQGGDPLSAIQSELDAVNSSVMALVNPYGDLMESTSQVKTEGRAA